MEDDDDYEFSLDEGLERDGVCLCNLISIILRKLILNKTATGICLALVPTLA